MKVGRLTAERFLGRVTRPAMAGPPRQRSFWLCVCDCGNPTLVEQHNFLNRVRSCGCLRREVCALMGSEHRDETRFPTDVLRVARNMFRQYRSDAKSKSRKFCISWESFLVIVQLPCYLCGCTGTLRSASDRTRFKGEQRTYPAVSALLNGVDRLDPSGHYTLDNVRPCCTTCNRIKLDLSLDAFNAHVDRVISHRGGRQ